MNINAKEIIETAEKKARPQFEEIEDVALHNQRKVLKAFQNRNIALRHFAGTTGYGYGDEGRDVLNLLFADIFDAQSAIVSPHILSGTHALTVALFGVLRPNDVLLSVTGSPYDTLLDVINGENIGSLKDFNVKYDQIEMIGDEIDYESIKSYLAKTKVKMIFIQRSRGYNLRRALNIEDIEKVVKLVKSIDKDIIVMVDNCYGEFVEKIEPTTVGADLIAGSLIKNVGGGIAPTGGYVAGRADIIELIAGRIVSPSIGSEVGSYTSGYQYFYQGIFLAPHTTSQALKGSVLFAHAFEEIGFESFPKANAPCGDIIRSIILGNEKNLVSFIQAIQNASPVDSFLTLEPWDMPGYDSKVVMAAGAFVQGSSIELSADSPIKEPYIAYIQGGLTYEHCKIAIEDCLNSLNKLY